MYSFAALTMWWKASRSMLDRGSAGAGVPDSAPRRWGGLRSRSAITSARRSRAPSNAAPASTFPSGHTGVITATESSMVSKTAITVGLRKRPSGVPSRSGLASGSRSTSRTMS